MTGISRVDAVPDPIFCRCPLAGVVENFLEMHERGPVFHCETGDDFLTLLDARNPSLPVRFPGPDGQGEWLAEHEADVGIGRLGSSVSFCQRFSRSKTVFPLIPRLRKVRFRSAKAAPYFAAMMKA
jgi:hypothetical protein